MERKNPTVYILRLFTTRQINNIVKESKICNGNNVLTVKTK